MSGAVTMRRAVSAAQEALLVFHGRVHGIDQVDRPFFARVHGLAKDAEFEQLVRADAEPGEDGPLQGAGVVVERQLDLVRRSMQPLQRAGGARRPASQPDDQAHCRLKPPQSPSTSSTSPQKYSPGTRRDSRVSGSTSRRSTPPAVTWASGQGMVPAIARDQLFSSRASAFRAAGDISAPGRVW